MSKKMFGSFLSVYFFYEGLVGGNVLLSDCQRSFHHVALVATGPFMAQAKFFCAGSVFTLFYTTGTGTGKFNSSFIWHNPHAVTVEVLSLSSSLVGQTPPPAHRRFPVITILINPPKAPLSAFSHFH